MATLRQKIVASKMVENGGNIGKAMIEAGYSSATAKTPQKLTKSKGWKELMDNIFPDSLLVKKHLELLNARKLVVAHWGGKTDIFKVIDYPIVGRALDMIYKIKGYYSPKKHEASTNSLITDDQLKRILRG